MFVPFSEDLEQRCRTSVTGFRFQVLTVLEFTGASKKIDPLTPTDETAPEYCNFVAAKEPTGLSGEFQCPVQSHSVHSLRITLASIARHLVYNYLQNFMPRRLTTYSRLSLNDMLHETN
jgi:hypothetical protein